MIFSHRPELLPFDAMRLVSKSQILVLFFPIAINMDSWKCSISLRLFSFALFDWFLHDRVKLRAPMPVGVLECTYLERWGAFESGQRGTCSSDWCLGKQFYGEFQLHRVTHWTSLLLSLLYDQRLSRLIVEVIHDANEVLYERLAKFLWDLSHACDLHRHIEAH